MHGNSSDRKQLHFIVAALAVPGTNNTMRRENRLRVIRVERDSSIESIAPIRIVDMKIIQTISRHGMEYLQ